MLLKKAALRRFIFEKCIFGTKPAATASALRRGRAPGPMAPASLICWRSVSATTDVSILLTVPGISPFDCGELGVLAELLTPGAKQFF